MPSVGPFRPQKRLPKSPAAPVTPLDLMQHRPGGWLCRQFHRENVGTWWEEVGQWLENLRKQWFLSGLKNQNFQSGGKNDIFVYSNSWQKNHPLVIFDD